MFGSFAALVRFARGGLVDGRLARGDLPARAAGRAAGRGAGAAGEARGAQAAGRLVLLVAVALFLTFRRAPPPGGRARAAAPARCWRSGRSSRWSSAPTTASSARAPAPSSSSRFVDAARGTALRARDRGREGGELRLQPRRGGAVRLRGVVLWQVALPMAAAQFAGGVDRRAPGGEGRRQAGAQGGARRGGGAGAEAGARRAVG